MSETTYSAERAGAAQERERLRSVFVPHLERPICPLPELIVLLDEECRVLSSSRRYAGPRLERLEFPPGSTPPAVMMSAWGEADTRFEVDWRRAWEARASGLPIEWLFQPKSGDCCLKLRLQPVNYTCADLYGEALSDFGDCTVLFIQDVSALDRRKGVDSPKSPRKVAIFPLRRASDHQPNLVASLDERLRSVTSRMLSAHEAERKRIASELHDCLGQSLSLLRYEIEALLASSSEPEESHEAAIVRLHNYSRRALEELRSIVSDLRPTIIDDRGLIGALEALCEDFRVMSGHIEIRCDVSGDSRRIDDRLAIAVYRIAQEALNNVLRHADAGHSSLVFTMNEESVTLIVTDDGRGLPHGQALRTGLGLFTMRERAESLGGSFEIETRAGEGCRIRARWPIE